MDVVKHDKQKEFDEYIDLIGKKSRREKVNKEFKHIIDADDKYFNAEFVAAQANEIVRYLYRLRLTPLRAWESFIRDAINKNKDVFLHDFYLKENEYGELEIDHKRINTLILEDVKEED